MKILVDARMLRAGGIGRYLREITGPWMDPESPAGVASVEKIRFLGWSEELEPWLAGADRRGIAEVETWRHPIYSARAQLLWPGFWQKMFKGGAWRPDVTFFPHYDVPLLSHPQPSVVTIHDLTHFRFPRGFPGWKRQAGRLLLAGALERAARIVSVSEHTRKDLLAMRPGVQDRVRVVPNGVASIFRPLFEEEASGARERWADLMPYVLSMGEFKPHKNLALTAETVARVRESDPDLRLVFAGGAEEAFDAFRRSWSGRGPTDWMVRVDAPTDAELRELYALSVAFLFPSLYEGFGLPPLEAVACGATVLASHRASLPEVLEGRALLLDPEQPQEWEEELKNARTRPDTYPYPGNVHVAPDSGDAQARVGLPTWDEASRKTLEVLKEVAGA